jgi:SSS family solute:Na+ symporter
LIRQSLHPAYWSLILKEPFVPNLTAVDWLILLLYFLVVLGIGYSLRSEVKSSKDFLLAGRTLPAWICGLAFIAASLGSQELIAMGAAGAKFGFEAAQFFAIGAIPAMIFVGVVMMPLYYGSKARSVPEFLGFRFDLKTRVLNACLFAALAILSAGISMYLMASIFQALHVFDGLFYALGWPRQGTFTFCIVLSAAIVLAYVLFAGLRGAMVNQVLQFFLIVAGFLPMVLLGLKNIGGWSGLKAAASLSGFQSVTPAGAMSPNSIGLGLGLGIVFGAVYWCTDFRVIQTAMAAKNMESARRAPLIAAIPRMFLPFLVILPGLIAIGLPTPHSTTVVREEKGVIYHETTVVSRAASEGRGLVPARVDAVTGNPMLDATGQPLLDYDRATPNMLLHFLPAGLLGLGLAALLASLMSGMAASVTAFNTVFTYDLYQSTIHKGASDRYYLKVGRWATVGAVLLSTGTAYAFLGFSSAGCNGILSALLLVLAVMNAPLFATVLLGMFSRRATGHGAFAGLLAGFAAAVLHHGLTLPAEAHPGLHGGWIAVLHRYPSDMSQYFWTAILAFTANLIVAAAVSLCTRPKFEAELVGLVHSLTPRPRRAKLVWWKRPETLAAAILLAAAALSLFFA